MELLVTLPEFYRLVDHYAQRKIGITELGQKAVKTRRELGESSCRVNGKTVLATFFPLSINEYRTRGFIYSNRLGCPIQHPTITGTEIWNKEVQVLMAVEQKRCRQGVREILWQIIDHTETPRYVLQFIQLPGLPSGFLELNKAQSFVADDRRISPLARRHYPELEKYLQLEPREQ